ncbi:amidohydrolase family protein [Streptomyces sp. NPDC007084]|uniref:amidohydrolase family protein n=1 Tax=Streptomyces sp. NPDC007084 TaxID=3154313 RepID=UPI003451FAA9
MTPPPPVTGQAAAGRDTAVLLKNATVVDTRDGTLAPGTDVLIRADRIVDVRPGIVVTDGPEPFTVDARGKYVVPGYADMHAHPLGQRPEEEARDLELLLAHGVTGFRQMSGSLALLEKRASGTLGLPAASPELLALPGPLLLTPVNAATGEQAVAAVREQHAAGADFIKAAMVTPEVFFAAQAEALRLGLPIVGHLPVGIDVPKASRIGMKSIEHLGPGVGLFACCSTDGAHVHANAAGQPAMKVPPFKLPFMERVMERVVKKLVINPINRTKPADIENLRLAVRTFDDDLAAELAERFVADGTWQVPTLIRVKTQELCDDPAFANDPDLRYMGEATVRSWKAAARKFTAFPAEARETFRAVYRRQLELTKLFDDAGVPMLVGSDCSGAAWVVPGASLHHEFDELARAGLTPLRVLQMTTLRAAEFLDATDTMGTVEPGRRADLVLLDADPVERVEHLHRIAGVVRAGQHYGAAELDALKERVAARA